MPNEEVDHLGREGGYRKSLPKLRDEIGGSATDEPPQLGLAERLNERTLDLLLGLGIRDRHRSFAKGVRIDYQGWPPFGSPCRKRIATWRHEKPTSRADRAERVTLGRADRDLFRGKEPEA
ncbi:MAG: hypothetical protein IPK80_01775 [Nannocystis sp.]|nr:hypothetical protein [Nannocystis sp.]